MLSDSPLFLQKNLLINLNRKESSNLLGMAAELHVGFLCLAVTGRGRPECIRSESSWRRRPGPSSKWLHMWSLVWRTWI